jgi:hypothetical protein
MCVWAGVSRSGFYDWLTRPASASVARRRELEVIVAHLFQDCDGTYGYRRLHAELVRGQVPCSLELRGCSLAMSQYLRRRFCTHAWQPRGSGCSLAV